MLLLRLEEDGRRFRSMVTYFRGHCFILQSMQTALLAVAVHKPQYYLYFLNDPETIYKLAEPSELVL